MLKKSKYTFDLRDNKDNLILCNLLYKTKAIIPSEDTSLIEAYNNMDFSKIPDAIFCMQDNKFIVECDLDEWQLAEQAKTIAINQRNEILNITIKPTVSCNLDCIYCWQKDETGFMEQDIADRIIKFIEKKVNSKVVKKVVIDWFGGEPTLAFDRMVYIMQEIEKICRANRVPYVGLISTNGTLLTPERVKTLLRYHIYSFQITLDGTQEVHDKCRPLKQKGQSSYDIILKNLLNIRDTVKKSYLEIIVRVNVTKDFLQVKDEFIAMYKSNFHNDNRFSLLLEDVTDKGGDKIDKYKDEIFLKDVTRDTLVSDLLKDDIIQHNFMNYGHATMMCNVLLDNSFNINYDGTIYCCEMLSDKNNTKEINNYGKIDIDGNIEKYGDKSHYWRETETLSECYECKLYPDCCGGLCPLSKKNTKSCHYMNNLEIVSNSLRMLAKDGLLQTITSNTSVEQMKTRKEF